MEFSFGQRLPKNKIKEHKIDIFFYLTLRESLIVRTEQCFTRIKEVQEIIFMTKTATLIHYVLPLCFLTLFHY